MSETCCVCVEPFTKQKQKARAACPYCDILACRKCTQTYLLNTTEDPHCMGCRKAWTREVMDSLLVAAWVNGDYKKHRENVLLDRERSRLPAAQLIIERKKMADERRPVIDAIYKELAIMTEARLKVEKELMRELGIITALRRGEDPWANQTDQTKKPAEERRVFIMPCPADGCRGFLSQAYKCGVCDIYVCAECREIKGKERDGPHTCNADTVATVQKLKKECRPCPDCGTQIFKIEGCYRMDTPIRLWNGGVKMSQDIAVGDELIGDDGNKRTVLSLVDGEDELYEVRQTNGDTYIVNSKHTLVLKYSGDKSLHWNESAKFWKVQWFDRELLTTRTKNFTVSEYSSKDNAEKHAEAFISTLVFPETIELTIEQYNKLDKWTKRNMMGFKSSAGVHYEAREIELDAYLLGLWLGDGTHSHPIIASNDIEVQQYLVNWCKNNDAELVHDEGVKFRIRRRGNTNHKSELRAAIGTGHNSSTCVGCKYKKMDICDTIIDTTKVVSTGLTNNPLTDLLKKYNLLNNKHIPPEYVMNSREIRLNLLAGLIDTDGNVPKDQQGKRAVIVQTEGRLATDIVYLAKSLGFVVNVNKTERKNVSIFGNEPKDFKDIYRINISGENLCDIPTLISRKKCVGFTPNKDYYRSGIEVTFKEYGKYYGWSVDGNKRFLHSDFTVLRNCDQMFCTHCNTPFSWTSGKRITTGALHNPHYFDYIRKMGNGDMPRTPGDIPCLANLPAAYQITNLLKQHPWKTVMNKPQFDDLMAALRSIHHIQQIEIESVTNRQEDIDNTTYNIDYLSGQMTEDKWKKTLQQREKRRLKRDEFRMRYEALVGAFIDIYGTFMQAIRAQGTTLEKVEEQMVDSHLRMTTLVNLFNESMIEIGKRYKCQVITLCPTLFKVQRVKAKTFLEKVKEKTPKANYVHYDTTDDETESETEGAQNVVVPTG